MSIYNRISPVPQKFGYLEGKEILLGVSGSPNYTIEANVPEKCELSANAVKKLTEKLAARLAVCPCSAKGEVKITLQLADAPEGMKNADQGYAIKAADNAITLTGYGAAGLYYAVTTLLQCLKVEEGNSAIQNKLLTGEYMAAIILEENILKLQETKKEPLKVVYPKEGCILISSPICIMKSTKNPEGAKAAVDWWLSKEGQQAVTKGWMHSVRPDVAPPNGAPKLETLLPNAIKVDWNKMATQEAEIKNEFRTRVMDKK